MPETTTRSRLTVDLQLALEWPQAPRPADFQRWAEAALVTPGADRELTIRVVSEAEMTALNTTYRHKSGPTNVLSFLYEPAATGVAAELLGDVVICAPIVAREASVQGKPVLAHWAHLVVHGALHLQGYDHQRAAEAAAMERLETKILNGLGFPDPYGDVGQYE